MPFSVAEPGIVAVITVRSPPKWSAANVITRAARSYCWADEDRLPIVEELPRAVLAVRRAQPRQACRPDQRLTRETMRMKGLRVQVA